MVIFEFLLRNEIGRPIAAQLKVIGLNLLYEVLVRLAPGSSGCLRPVSSRVLRAVGGRLGGPVGNA
jgi:hypothetical protein